MCEWYRWHNQSIHSPRREAPSHHPAGKGKYSSPWSKAYLRVDLHQADFMNIWHRAQLQQHGVSLHLDNLVVIDVVQRIGAVSSSNHRWISQEVGTMDTILKIKLERHDMSKESRFQPCRYLITRVARYMYYTSQLFTIGWDNCAGSELHSLLKPQHKPKALTIHNFSIQ